MFPPPPPLSLSPGHDNAAERKKQRKRETEWRGLRRPKRWRRGWWEGGCIKEGVGSTETRDKVVKTSEESVDSTREEAVQQTPCGEGDGENASTRDPQKRGGGHLSLSLTPASPFGYAGSWRKRR
jgi:hypothetical protein